MRFENSVLVRDSTITERNNENLKHRMCSSRTERLQKQINNSDLVKEGKIFKEETYIFEGRRGEQKCRYNQHARAVPLVNQ